MAGKGVGYAGAQLDGGSGQGRQGRCRFAVAVAGLGFNIDDSVVPNFLPTDRLAHGVIALGNWARPAPRPHSQRQGVVPENLGITSLANSSRLSVEMGSGKRRKK